ncbi:MAG TPA: YciI family protein [Gemmatimonadaceae bacterium]|nr:YciI family protein [Gemmatimonadaceae bacterium]
MRFLCLIYLDEKQMAALPAPEMDSLNARHLDLNDDLRASGHFVEAEALEPSTASVTLRLRNDKRSVIDGPFTEAKEMVAGFYLIDARDVNEAVEIASRFPSAPLGRVEIWPTRQLVVPGRAIT